MEFFLHSTTAHYSRLLLKLEHDYGLAAIGFYWKAVELIILSGKKIPIHFFQSLRHKPLRFFDVYGIIYSSELFDIDENFFVTLAQDPEKSIGLKSYENYLTSVRNSVIADERDNVIASTRNSACVCPGPIEMNKEKIRLDGEAQKQLSRFMHLRCPHLLEMEDPLTLEEYRELKKDYTWRQIQGVLVNMENEVGLSRRKRSCYQTALTWLTNKYGAPKGDLKQKENNKLCGLDENGSPIYKQIKNKNNGKQDSNSAVRPADAEQQGDGSGCAEWPDE